MLKVYVILQQIRCLLILFGGGREDESFKYFGNNKSYTEVGKISRDYHFIFLAG